MEIHTIGLNTQLNNSDDLMLKLDTKHDDKEETFSLTKEAKEYLSESK